MASSPREETQKPSNDLVTKNTSQGSTQDPSTSDSSYQSLHHHSNGGYENMDNLKGSCHEYEALQPRVSACQNDKGSTKNPQSSLEIELQDIKSKEPLTKELSSGHIDVKTSWVSLSLGFIGITAIVALMLTVLLLTGVIGPKWGCSTNQESTKQCKENIQPNVSTSFLLKKIEMLEKNMSSLVRQLKSKYGGNGCNGSNGSNNSNGSNEGNGGICGNCGNKENSSSSSTITTEVKKLREKQVQLDSSLTKLKESDKAKASDIQDMSSKVNGLAVAVKSLSANDSLIKSKVHTLSQTEVELRSSLEELKQKDVEVHTSLKRAKGVEAFLNSSVSQLKSIVLLIKNEVDQLNSTFMTKINSINSTVNTMQKGGAGPPGPPGPRGPRGIPGTLGAGNLSQCQHHQEKSEFTSGPSSDGFVNFIEPKDKIVVGATCSSIRGDETYLSSRTNSRGQKVYVCTCRGQSNYAYGSGKLECFIDVWVCPRIS